MHWTLAGLGHHTWPPSRTNLSRAHLQLLNCCFLTAGAPGAQPHLPCLGSGPLHWKLVSSSGSPTRKHLPGPLTRLRSSDLCYLRPVLVPGPCRVSPKLGFWIRRQCVAMGMERCLNARRREPQSEALPACQGKRWPSVLLLLCVVL